MPLDGIVLNSIVKELNKTILHGRIDKIHQPEKDELLFNIRNNGESYKLLISAGSSYPRIHITLEKKINPVTPPVFCMLLRKHLNGARIREIKQINFDRIIEIVFEVKNEMKLLVNKSLLIEIMGKHSNITLIDTNTQNIIDSIKRIGQNLSSKRQIFPGINYTLPPSKDKNNPTLIDKDKFFCLIKNNKQDITIFKFFYLIFNGFSPLISKELCYLSEIDENTTLSRISENKLNTIWINFNSIMNKINTENYSYSIYNNSINNFYDFHCLEINHVYTEEKINFLSISLLLDSFYNEKDNKNRIKQKSSNLLKSINTKLFRNRKKLLNQKQDLYNAEDREKYRIYGDLIIGNIHLLKKGDSVTVTNYYDDNASLITIPLDPKLSLSQNAQKYYKKYNKLKTAEEELYSLIESNEKEIIYLENVIYCIEQAHNLLEIEEITEELAAQGFIKKKNIKKKSKTESTPLTFYTSKNHEILVGKNNKQNDLITFKYANKDDVWFHAKKIPGSHVIIRTNGDELTDKEYLEGARLAAYYSKSKESSSVEVDYTKKINIKKPPASKPGFVIYDKYYSVIVKPDISKIKTSDKII